MRRHSSLMRMAALLLLLVATFTGCERKDLWLHPDNGTIDIMIYDVRLDFMWGADWKTQWQYDWDEALYGPIGYTKPNYVRAFIYELDKEKEFRRKDVYTRNFSADGGRVSLKTNSWYDMLLYNAGTEYILFNQSPDYDYYNVSTRESNLESTITRKNNVTGKEEPDRSYTIYKQPDEFFAGMLPKLKISDDPSDYEKVYDEETGEIIYIYHTVAEVYPYSFIYLLQVMVINNEDEKGRIVGVERSNSAGEKVLYGAKAITTTGLSAGTNLFGFNSFTERGAITVDESDIRHMQHRKELRLPDGTVAEGDVFAARMLSWGLPGIQPYNEWEKVLNGDFSTQYKDRNKLGVRFYTRNGATYTWVFDVTEQLRSHPLGGVITVVFDADEIPEIPDTPPSSGGGFNADVQPWENEINADVKI